MYKKIINHFLQNLLLLCTFGLVIGQSTAVHAKSVLANSQIPTFECLIQPDMVVQVSSPINGIFDEIFVDTSDYVKKGQLLAQLESGVQKAVVAMAQARATRQDEIHLRQTDLDFAKRKLNRIIELHNQSSVSPSEKDEAETTVTLAELELQKAVNNHELAKLEHTKAKRLLRKRQIRSPIDGIITYRTASPGEAVGDKPIFSIAKIALLKVELIVPVEYFGKITEGMTARIMPEIISTFEHIATVTVVDKVIDAPSGTFAVRLALPNAKQQLPGGLKCQAQFIEKK